MELIADRYEIEREIGRGGMGVVLLARDSVIDRHVALKRLAMSQEFLDSADAVERFAREARLTGRLSHPQIVTLFDVLNVDEMLYLVLEYYESMSLAEVVRDRGVLDEVATRLVGGEIASALASAHAAEIVHRDIKPDNVLLGDAGAKLTDFGIARSLADSASASVPLTKTGLLVGTPSYMSPEQARGEGATPAADIFATGTLLWFALTGGTPFGIDDPATTLYRIVHQDLDVSTLPVSPGLRSAIAAATSKSASDRPTADELRSMLVGPAGRRSNPAS